MSWWAELPRGVSTAVVEVVRLVLVRPFRDGRLRASGWPPGLAAVVGLGLTAFVASASLVLAAPLLRQRGALVTAVGGELLLPRWATPVFLTLTVVALSLLYAASLHLPRWLRVLTPLVVALTMIDLLVSPPDQGLAPHVVAWVGSGLLAVFSVLRWRACFRWWEFVVAMLVIGTTIAVSLRLVAGLSQPIGFDTAPLAVVLSMQVLSQLAIPFTFAAGVAFAQLALSVVHRVGEVVDERIRPTARLLVVVVLLAVAQVTLTVRRLVRPSDTGSSHAAELGAATTLLLLGLVLALLVLRRTPPDTPPDTDAGTGPGDGLGAAVTGLGLPIALLVTVTVLPQLVLTRADTMLLRYFGHDGRVLDDASDFLVRSDVISWSRLLVGIGLVAWALRGRRPAAALLAVSVGVTLVLTAVANVTEHRIRLPWTAESLSSVAGVLALAALVALAVTGRLTRQRLLMLGMMLGLALAFSVRASFGAPFVTLLGLGITAASFLSVVWATLIDADDANGDSERWPRPARVLLFLGNALLAMEVLAFVQVARAGRIGVDVSAFTALGDDFLGTGLLLAAYAWLGWQAVAAPLSPRSSPDS